MERIGLLRKNLVYPDRLEMAAMMRGPRAAGAEGAWHAGPSDAWGHTPMPAWNEETVDKCSWLEMAEAFRKNNEVTILQHRPEGDQAQGPLPLQPIVPQLLEAESSQPKTTDQEPQLEGAVRDRMSELLRRFAERAARSRARLEMPLTPSSDGSPSPSLMRRINSHEEMKPEVIQIHGSPSHRSKTCLAWWDYENCNIIFDPHGLFYLIWLLVVTLCYAYNCWVIPLRWSFPYQTKENTPIWLSIDSFCDILYLIDVAIIKPRVSFLSDGVWVKDPIDTRKNYIKKFQFKMDLIALLPLEALYAVFGTSCVWLRLPRLFKVQSFSEFYNSVDRVLSSPFIVRIGRTLIYMFYLIHLNACAYYAVSKLEGIGSNGWVFNGVGNAYIRCFYFATKTATSIGKNPKPENELEYVFMTFAWLLGVFVFALLISQIRDIVATATRSQTDYRKLVDDTMEYMRNQKIPKDLQHRVTSWFKFTWAQQHTLDDNRSTLTLPLNLQTDVAINVHIETLSKVQLFKDCDEALLRDLVLKLRLVIFLPGDLICRKGEVGKEMYIVKEGYVQVMGGNDNSEILATLHEGSVFGEISLLSVSGGNRRTADVRSVGFSDLFVLSKTDLNAALVYYPAAQEILRKKAKSLVRMNAEAIRKANTRPDDIIIGNPVSPPRQPRVMSTIMQTIPPNSGAGQLLRRGTRYRRLFEMGTVRSRPLQTPFRQPPPPILEDSNSDNTRRGTLSRRNHMRKVVNRSKRGTNVHKLRNCSSEPSLHNVASNVSRDANFSNVRRNYDVSFTNSRRNCQISFSSVRRTYDINSSSGSCNYDANC